MAVSLKHKIVIASILIYTAFAWANAAHAATIKLPVNNAGLVGYWPFNEGVGSATYDYSGNSGTGALSGTTKPAWTTGKYGRGLSFNGTSAYITIPDSTPLNLSGSVTFAAWIKPSNISLDQKVGGKQDSNNGYKMTLYTDNKIEFELDKAGNAANLRGLSGGTALSAGTWYFVACTYNGTSGIDACYVNGALDRSSNVGTSALGASTGVPLVIGTAAKDSYSNLFNGLIDEVRVYNYALSATQIAALYNGGKTRYNTSSATLGTGSTLKSGLMGWWTFDGSTMGTTIQDSSGQGNNGYTDGSVATSSMKVQGELGQAIRVNGTSSYITVPGSTGLNYYPITVSAWFKTTYSGSGSVGIVNKYLSSSLNGYQIFMQNGNLCAWYFKNNTAYVYDSTGCTLSTPGYNDGKWHLATFAVDSGGGRLYVDGVLKGTQAWVGATPGVDNSSQAVSIGTYPGSTPTPYFPGSIDDVRIYNRALSGSEARQLYQEGAVKVAPASTLQNGTTLASGLVGYWSFNGPDVTDKIYDRAGANNGYLGSGVSTSSIKVQGKLGQALSFNGSNVYVRVPDAAALDTNAFTLSVWVKYTSSQLGGLISKAAAGTEMLLLVGGGTCGNASASGKIRFDVNISNSIACADSPAAYNDGKWHLITATRDGSGTGNMVLYVDGAQVATATKAGDMTTTQPLAIGQHIPASTWFFNGSMDEVRMYNRALSASEVKQLYNLGK